MSKIYYFMEKKGLFGRKKKVEQILEVKKKL